MSMGDGEWPLQRRRQREHSSTRRRPLQSRHQQQRTTPIAAGTSLALTRPPRLLVTRLRSCQTWLRLAPPPLTPLQIGVLRTPPHCCGRLSLEKCGSCGAEARFSSMTRIISASSINGSFGGRCALSPKHPVRYGCDKSLSQSQSFNFLRAMARTPALTSSRFTLSNSL